MSRSSKEREGDRVCTVCLRERMSKCVSLCAYECE